MPIKDYEDVTVYGLDLPVEDELIAHQKELTFSWVTKDGSPMAAIMSYLRTDDGHFWMTASRQRKRIPAIQRDGRVALTITSPGTPFGPGKTVTYKGTAIVHKPEDDDFEQVKGWFYLALGRRLYKDEERAVEFSNMLNSPRRVIVEIIPGLRVGYDGSKMRQATDEARDAGALKWE